MSRSKTPRPTRRETKARPKPNQTAAARLAELRHDYELTTATLARLIGQTEATAQAWVEGTAEPDTATTPRVEKVQTILAGLARVMRLGFIDRWLQTPNPSCAGRTPAEVMEQGDYGPIEDMIYYFESGLPS